jgi:CheY-like chemotaxis protein/two-component sensor histidine kinase
VLRRAEAIKIGAERCARIVKNFLALARHRPSQRERVALHDVIREAIELLAYELRTSGIAVILELGDNVPALWADSHELHQVLVNLLANARHAMLRSTSPRRIVIRTAFEAGANRVRVEVADTGVGIPADVQARIFEPFFTTKAAGEGTGLGLSLSRGIIQEHGGTMSVDSVPGTGTTFVIELPVRDAPVAVTKVTAHPPQPGRRGSILVVDDEVDLTVTLADALARDGHSVDTALDGAKALELLARNTYDLVLTDTSMPLLDGAGLYAAVRQRFPDLGDRLIFITGDLLDPQKQAFLASTGASVVAKPFDIADLRALVRRLLETPRR